MSNLKFPKTFRGWMALLWLTLRRCPACKHGLRIDPWGYGQASLYCLNCEGWRRWPNGMIQALRENKLACSAVSEGESRS